MLQNLQLKEVIRNFVTETLNRIFPKEKIRYQISWKLEEMSSLKKKIKKQLFI